MKYNDRYTQNQHAKQIDKVENIDERYYGYFGGHGDSPEKSLYRDKIIDKILSKK